MRIVYCSNRFWPADGGLEVYLRNIVREMSKDNQVSVVTLIRDDCQVLDTLLNPVRQAIPASAEDTDYTVTTLQLSRVRRLVLKALRLESVAQDLFEDKYYLIRSLCIRYTARLLSHSLRAAVAGADVIHSMGPWELSHAVNMVRGDIPHVVTGFLHTGHWADDDYSLEHFRACDHIIALSQAESRQYQQCGISADRISVIGVPGCVTEQHAYSAMQSALDDLPARFVLFLGVKRDYKGLDLLLESAPYVWQVLPDVGFVFAGPRTDYSRRLFRSAPNDPRIIEVDRIPEEAKADLLQKCSLLCLPSATEIMPNVILESWLMKKPVVASAIPTLLELVGDAGICVHRNARELSDAISLLIDNPKLASDLGRKGWERCMREHNITLIKTKLEEAYSRTVFMRGRPLA
jgi:glycosyltransferase involved in cell wall biosynthesis